MPHLRLCRGTGAFRLRVCDEPLVEMKISGGGVSPRFPAKDAARDYYRFLPVEKSPLHPTARKSRKFVIA
jgi:hypothetical protein